MPGEISAKGFVTKTTFIKWPTTRQAQRFGAGGPLIDDCIIGN